MKRNQIMESLKTGPKTNSELPYKFGVIKVNPEDRCKVRFIKVAGRRSKKSPLGIFRSIYYLKDDEDLAITKFIEVNKDILDTMDFSKSHILQSGLSKNIAKKIIEGVRSIQNL